MSQLLHSGFEKDPAQYLAHVGVMLSHHGGHAGLIFKQGDQVWLLHLRWHHELEAKLLSNSNRLFWYEPDLAPNTAKFLSRLAAKVAANAGAQKVTYAFDATGCGFDFSTGNYQPGAVGTGLTCATFVQNLFAQVGLHLLKMESWQTSEEDEAFKQLVVDQLAEKLGDAHPHVVAMRTRTECFRVRPTDVAAGALTASAQWPVEFLLARTVGQAVLGQVSA